MKTRTLGLVALLALGCFTLVGCNKANTTVENPDENVEMPNPAAVYCEENGGILNLENGLCIFDDGSSCEEWAYYRGECQPGESLEVVLPEDAKTSLTNEELDELAETHFPVSYTYTVYNTETEQSDSGEYTYPEDLSHTLLVPEHATMASREVLSSGIEDGMIYTDTVVKLQDDTEIKVLYVVNPETLDFVAANVENGNEIRNYQFAY